MEVYRDILGALDADDLAGSLHRLASAHAVDHLILPRPDLSRRRLRARTEQGHEIAIALPRDQKLFDGAVLALSEHHALVVQVEAEHWLWLQPRDAAAALKLGYFAGNLHWRVRFETNHLLVALDGPEMTYRERLADLLQSKDVAIVEAPTAIEGAA